MKRAVHREMSGTRVDRGDGKARQIIVGLLPDGTITARLKGTRTTYSLTAWHVWDMGRRMEKQAERIERKRRRKARREARMLSGWGLPPCPEGTAQP